MQFLYYLLYTSTWWNVRCNVSLILFIGIVTLSLEAVDVVSFLGRGNFCTHQELHFENCRISNSFGWFYIIVCDTRLTFSRRCWWKLPPSDKSLLLPSEESKKRDTCWTALQMEVARSSETLVTTHTCKRTTSCVTRETTSTIFGNSCLVWINYINVTLYFALRKSHFSFWRIVRGNIFENTLHFGSFAFLLPCYKQLVELTRTKCCGEYVCSREVKYIYIYIYIK